MPDTLKPSTWTTAYTLTFAGICITVLIVLGNALVTYGGDRQRSLTDPTAALRAEMLDLKGAVNDLRAQLSTLPDVFARVRQTEADMRRVEVAVGQAEARSNEKDAGQDRIIEVLRAGVAEQRERLAVIERTSVIPLPGRR